MTENELRTNFQGIMRRDFNDLRTRTDNFDRAAPDSGDAFDLLIFDYQLLVGKMDAYSGLFASDAFFEAMDTDMTGLEVDMMCLAADVFEIGAAAS